MTQAFLALGGNLGDPTANLLAAIAHLNTADGIRVEAISPLYTSVAIGIADQPDYANAVVQIDTELSPEALLNTCQAIEHALGRVRVAHWGPRTVDIDILLIDDLTLNTERLTIPHAQMQHRNFVLKPLFDLAPELQIPGLGALQSLANTHHAQGLTLADDPRWTTRLTA